MNRLFWLSGLLASLVLTGCEGAKLAGGGGAGNPPQSDVILSFKANSTSALAKYGIPGLSKSSQSGNRNPDSTFSVKDSTGTILTLSSIEVLVQRIEIGLPGGLTCAQIRGLYCKDSVASVIGPYSMDLMKGSASPSINFIKLPEGLYTSIGLELPMPILSQDSLVKSDLLNQNMVIRGKAAAFGQMGKSFEIKLDLDDGLDFRDSIGFRIESTALNILVLKLNVDGWFAGADFSRCLEQSPATSDSSGTTILHGDGFCDSLGFRIRQNIEASSEIDNEEQDLVH